METQVTLFKPHVTYAAVALAMTGCANPSSISSASLGRFGAPSLKDIFAPPPKPPHAAQPPAPAPKPLPASECGAVAMDRCLLDLGVIGPHGGAHD